MADVEPPPMFLDHTDRAIATGQPALQGACEAALGYQRSIGADESRLPLRHVPPVSELLAVPPERGGLSIAYLVMGHRSFAHATISRLIRVLWAPAHLFMVHLDARAPDAVGAYLERHFADRKNVVLMGDRRSVGWGAFSMVDVLLRSIVTALAAAPAFDFFINLSDVDVALRTNGEMVRFLSGHRTTSFVAVKFPD
eukprot:980921-Prymnesium_polylepis.1